MTRKRAREVEERANTKGREGKRTREARIEKLLKRELLHTEEDQETTMSKKNRKRRKPIKVDSKEELEREADVYNSDKKNQRENCQEMRQQGGKSEEKENKNTESIGNENFSHTCTVPVTSPAHNQTEDEEAEEEVFTFVDDQDSSDSSQPYLVEENENTGIWSIDGLHPSLAYEQRVESIVCDVVFERMILC